MDKGANLTIMSSEDRKHRSYSQLRSYLQCGKAFELERIVKAPRRPGMWNAGGTAVHTVIERWLIQQKAWEK